MLVSGQVEVAEKTHLQFLHNYSPSDVSVVVMVAGLRPSFLELLDDVDVRDSDDDDGSPPCPTFVSFLTRPSPCKTFHVALLRSVNNESRSVK